MTSQSLTSGRSGPVDIPQLVQHAIAAASERKAQDLRVLDLGEVSDFTDFFLVCTGTSDRQVQAIADAVTEALRAEKIRPLHSEGYQRAHWVLLDFGDFVVHIFQDDTRRFYDLERLWGDAPDVTQRFSL